MADRDPRDPGDDPDAAPRLRPPAPATAHAARFSAWDGTQEALGADLDDIFARLSEDVYHGWEFDDALRRLLQQGWRDRRGRKLAGFEETLDRLRRKRREELERYRLDDVFAEVRERLDGILRSERHAIDERLEAATEPAARRVLERVAAKRRATLEGLPPEPAGAIRQLQEYEWMDGGAETRFRELVEELRKQVVDTQFQDIAQQLQSMTPEDMARMAEMVRDVNGLLRQRARGVAPADLQQQWDRVRERWSDLLPDAPADFDAFVDQLMQRMAQADSLMQSMTPEMRRQLQEMMGALMGEGSLRDELAELAASLEMLSPRSRPGNRYAFSGSESLGLDQAMEVMRGLQSVEEIERAVHAAQRGEELDDATREAMREMLGDDALRDVDRLQQVMRELEERGLVERDGNSTRLTAQGMRRIGQKALTDLFSRLQRDRFGNHRIPRAGVGGERSDETRPYEPGDAVAIDVQQTVMNAVRRTASDPAPRVVAGGEQRPLPRLSADDFEIHREEASTRSSTVLMLDMSRSMPLRGYFYAAKKVALALDSLIRTQFPRDTLHIVGFSETARVIPQSALPQLTFQEYVYGTNLQHGLMLARHLLARESGHNKQIIVISDGEPTAHMRDGRPVFFYPPLAETFQKTLLEVRRCTRDDITINTFMLESNHHLVEFVKQMTRLNRGRAFFISPDRLGDYILVDYVRGRAGRAA